MKNYNIIEQIEKKDFQYNEDDRAQRLLNIFEGLDGQLNVSHVNSTDHVVAWHKHEIQTDYWVCIKGSFKVGLAIPTTSITYSGEVFDDKDNIDSYSDIKKSYRIEWEYLSDKQPKVLKIPPGVYHGYKALESGSTLLYYLTHKYDPKDEFRANVGDFGETWKTENK